MHRRTYIINIDVSIVQRLCPDSGRFIMSWQVNEYGSHRYAFLNVVTCLFQVY